MLAGLAFALALVALVALGSGAFPLAWADIVAILARSVGLPSAHEVTPQAASVLLAVRLPRVVLGIAAGAGLGAAGAVLQGVFRNPLADPALIGVSSGAALAVTAVIVAGSRLPAIPLPTIAGWLGGWLSPVAGFAGGLAATTLLYRVATREGRTSLTTMLLAGIAINALAFAGIGLLTTVATDAQLRGIAFWNFGSLGGAAGIGVAWIAALVVGICVVLVRMAPGLNALVLGDHEARHLGFDTQTLKRRVIALSALLAGIIVANCGVIGFVALVAPHLMRLVAGPDHRVVVPGAALLGAILLVVADLAARSIAAPVDLPIGIVTALLGAPFFLWLLMRHRERLA